MFLRTSGWAETPFTLPSPHSGELPSASWICPDPAAPWCFLPLDFRPAPPTNHNPFLRAGNMAFSWLLAGGSPAPQLPPGWGSCQLSCHLLPHHCPLYPSASPCTPVLPSAWSAVFGITEGFININAFIPCVTHTPPGCGVLSQRERETHTLS